MIKNKPITDLLFAYLMLYESVLSANAHWIRRTAELHDPEWSKLSESLDRKGQIDLIQERLTSHLDDEFYRYGNDPDFRKEGLTFDHDIQSVQGSTGKRLRFKITLAFPSTYTIVDIEDELNGDREFGLDLPHIIGSPTSRKDEIE